MIGQIFDCQPIPLFISLERSRQTWLHRQRVIGCEAMYVVFHSNFAAFIVCRRYKPCEFPGFVWTDCWGNKSYYVITSPANYACLLNWWYLYTRNTHVIYYYNGNEVVSCPFILLSLGEPNNLKQSNVFYWLGRYLIANQSRYSFHWKGVGCLDYCNCSWYKCKWTFKYKGALHLLPTS